MPVDVGHLVTSGITETNYTDCGRSLEANGLAGWPRQPAGWSDEIRLQVNEGESDPDTPATVYAGTRGGGVFTIQQVDFRYRLHLPVVLSGQ